MAQHRHYSPADRLLMHLHRGLSAVLGPSAERPNPAAQVSESPLSEAERHHAAGLMRVNHAGEIAAQALYEGQALTARNPAVRAQLKRAAAEEQDHLAWCTERIHELGEQPSWLAPVWYAGSFAIGAAAGLLGDKLNLGFVAETEKQVVEHLDGHLDKLPQGDDKSRAILEQMKTDETRHGSEAMQAGGAVLPGPVQRLMKLASRVMTKTAYWI
ncbi:MAG: 2-polyprenyl-3-methyl-6-methoxy-1,4-benzoquinone monooxygenase [Nevskiales bacterium]